MYKVNVDEKHSFELSGNEEGLLLGNKELATDIRELKEGHFHVIYAHKSYNVEVVSSDQHKKTAVIKINGQLYTTHIEDRFDRILKAMGMENGAVSTIVEIRAPMPGLVLDITVSEGQELRKGDQILVLEAMKMENNLKSTTEGVVKKIHVAKGDKVEKNQVLIEFQ